MLNLPSSSSFGSIEWASAASSYPGPAYKISKAALNSLTKQWALALESEDFTVLALNPGVRLAAFIPSIINSKLFKILTAL